MQEQDIMHETPCGKYWVGRDTRQQAYVVFKVGATHSTSDSGYHMTPDGLSIAIARADYLGKRVVTSKPASALERLCIGNGDVLPND